MKNVILGMCFGLFIMISITIIYTIDGRRIRKEETIESLSSAIESTVWKLNDNKYNIENNDIFVADFLQALLIQIGSDSDITVNILDVDYEKGLLSIEVIENNKHPNGKQGTLSCVKTVIFEPDPMINTPKTDEQIKITYLYPDNGLYKEFMVVKGSEIIIPQNPKIEGKTFKWWTKDGLAYNLVSDENYNYNDENKNNDENNNENIIINKVKVYENICLVAEFE